MIHRRSNALARLYALLLITLMLTSSLLIYNPQVSLAAGSEPSVNIESCQIAPGETAVVAITGQNIPSPGIAGYQLNIQYDSLKLEVLGLEKSAADSFSMLMPNLDAPGTVRLAAVQTTGVDGNITFARLRIKAKDSASGRTELKLSVNECVLENLKSLQVQTANGQIDISGESGQNPQPLDPLSISVVSLPTAKVNQSYSVTLEGNNGTPPYLWSASGLPPGLSLNPQTGKISGTPTSNAVSTIVRISLSDSQSPAQTVSLELPLDVEGLPIVTPRPEPEVNPQPEPEVRPQPEPKAITQPEPLTRQPVLEAIKTTRVAGDTAIQTAVRIAEQIVEQTGGTGTAILASSMSYGMVDALTAGPLASYLKAPILLTEAGNTLNPDTKAALINLGVKTVYVTSGTGVIREAVLNELKNIGITVVPLGGEDRFATSVNIAQTMVSLGAKVNKVAIAYGWQNQDALSIASIASSQTQPILLTEKDALPESVKKFLATNPNIKTSDVIGGTGVISEAVKAQLPKAIRHYGATAYDTNAQVIKDFDEFLEYKHVYLANGETAIDALAGAPLAAQSKAAIVLTNQGIPKAATFLQSKLTADSVVTALGGTSVVPAKVLLGVMP